MSLLCQGRDNGGEIGLLQNSPRFAFLAAPTDDFNIFDKLQLVIEFIKVVSCILALLIGVGYTSKACYFPR